ncbi:MAG: FAD-binding oxidoreductase [Chloroflexi bacterium]|nr:FAD-binding oxidoreductase [Chloroflexota bacterium]
MPLDTEALESLIIGFAGQILQPNDTGYDEARQLHNGSIDKRHAIIARCLGVADVQDAVKFARANDLEIAIRGGGHNVAGRAVCDDGMMIDLSLMKAVMVDPAARTARAQGGVTWGEFNRETQVYGLATTGGIVGTTGIAGLTLGGGLGWLMGKYGMTVDNVRGAEVVTATGDVVRASATENPDLLWALKGGGGNFGVVTSFEYDLHEVGPMITGGLVAFPFEEAGVVLRKYRDFAANLPDELTTFCLLAHAPDGSGAKIVAIPVCHCGPLDEGAAATEVIKSFGTPILDALGPIPYAAQNGLFDAGFPKGARNYWKSNFINGLTDELIDTLIQRFSEVTSPMSAIPIEHFHGAAVRPAPSATAYAHRTEGFNLVFIGEWEDAADDEKNIQWVRGVFDATADSASDVYVNYLGDDEKEGRIASAYGENFARLQQAKKTYDPENVFHLNQNITPA